MNVETVLHHLNLGSSVAESDTELERYFIVTDSFLGLMQGRYDIIAGDKGTGKTAIFLYMIGSNEFSSQLTIPSPKLAKKRAGE